MKQTHKYPATSQVSKQHPQPFILSSSTSTSISKSNTKFIIRYEQKQITTSGHKINKYSSKHQHQLIRSKKISESVLEKTKLKNADGSIPSYLKPTEASISAQLQRNRISSVADMITENKIGLLKMRSKSLEEEDQQEQRQYNRVPIQFYDEKIYGCGADSLRARVVFRGYAPKNTYYYLKTLKPFKRKPKKMSPIMPNSSFCNIQQLKPPAPTVQTIINQVPTSKNENDIRFESKFESGNLSAASKISQTQYWLYMRQDTNTHGLRQWYYFTVTNKKAMKIKFRIYRFTKNYSLYKMGMKPYFRTSAMQDFQQSGQKVKYQYDNIQKCYFLEFQYKFEEDSMEVEISMLPPYTYSMMKDYLRSLDNLYPFSLKQDIELTKTERVPISKKLLETTRNSNADHNQNENSQSKLRIQITSIGQSLAGLDIPMVKIRKQINKNEYQQKVREAIIVLARTHPGQTVSNFALESFIDTIVSNEEIVEFYDFFIVPMVNPDGVYFGNHRTSIIGQDLNRNFHTNDFQVFPEIQSVNNAINITKKTHRIRYLLDLHGHSARKNIFAYGSQHEINSPQYLHSRILPKLLNDAISSFKYDYCIFRESRQKKNTARVFFTNKYKINCLTFQQSYGIVQDGPIGVQHWRNFGISLANSLLQLGKMYRDGKEKAFETYLISQIEKQQIMLQKRNEKHRKMLGIGIVGENNQIDIDLDKRNKGEQVQDKMKNCLKIQNSSEIGRRYNMSTQEKREKQEEIEKKEGQQNQVEEREKEQGQEQDMSVNSSQLQSGDQSLQLQTEQVQTIKREIIRIGCLRQGLKRQKYNIADKKLQLFDTRQNQDKDPNLDPHNNMTNSQAYRQEPGTFRRLHEQKSSMIPRIAKLQQKRKEQYNLSFKREMREERRDVIEKQRLERRKEIQAKFKRMELPSIRKQK